jgi:RNA polymerase primary sigma factor
MSDRLLTAPDVTRLARRIEQGDAAAKDEMIIGNLRLVRSLAARYRGRGVAFEDLVRRAPSASCWPSRGSTIAAA